MTDYPNDDDNPTIGNNILDSDLEDSSEIVSAAVKETDRKITPQSVRDYISDRTGVQMWETDPATLRDYAQNTFVQSYIDQIAKDVATADYTVSDDKAKLFLENASPRFSWSDLLEATARELLETGNAFWGKHYDSGNIAEVVLADSQTMYISEDDMGFVDGYVQAISSGQNIKSQKIDKDDVIHFTWGSDVSRDYASAPVQKSLDIIDILDELLREDINNLRAGAINGVIGVEGDVSSQELKKMIKRITKKDKGKRHKVSAVEGKPNYVNINDNYSDMSITERYNTHIRNLATHFKVSPDYVGFESSEGGIGQGKKAEEERKNHREGVKVILDQIENKINEELLRPEFGAELTFKVESEEEKDNVEHYENIAETSQKLQEAGIPHTVENGQINLENAEFDSMDNDSEKEETVQKPEEVENCVDSILEDNPDMDKSTAYAICNEQIETSKEVDDKYLEAADKDQFIPNQDMYEAAKKVRDWYDEHSDEIDAFGSDGEGLRRVNQIIRHYEDDEPLSTEYWNEIEGYHSRHHAQDNHILDSEFEDKPWMDNGYISHLAWGGDAGYEQAQEVMDIVDDVDSEEESEKSELSERKKELIEETDYEDIKTAVKEIDEKHDKRINAISDIQDILSGTLSQSTYYEWLDEYDLR